MKQKYEYVLLDNNRSGRNEAITGWLNEMAAEGWEFMFVHPQRAYKYFFRREIQE